MATLLRSKHDIQRSCANKNSYYLFLKKYQLLSIMLGQSSEIAPTDDFTIAFTVAVPNPVLRLLEHQSPDG
jgi:hypothetical protein